MAFLKKPLLGPIVGHTTETSSKLWIAAYGIHDSDDIDASKRTIGVIGLVDENGKVPPENIWYFRMKRCYHRTGYFDVGKQVGLWQGKKKPDNLKAVPLKPDTHYQARLAYIELDTTNEEPDDENSEKVSAKLPPASSWEVELNLKKNITYVTANFKTQPKTAARAEDLSLLLGSCRYTAYKSLDGRSDQIFRPMYEKHSDVDMVMMVGDQIYSDYLSRYVPFKANTYQEYEERYHTNFGTPYFRQLVSNIPTYMILDDHEIEDNWTSDRLYNFSFFDNKRALFTNAMMAYRSYQWIHGPMASDSLLCNRTLMSGSPAFDVARAEPLYYDFSCCGYPFFVLDTRTTRYKNSEADPAKENIDLHDNYIIGRPSFNPADPGQQERLCAWLIHSQRIYGNRPKFIVSSTVFAPNPVNTVGSGSSGDRKKNASDSWAAFPDTRELILTTISENQVKNVIFLSGDIHCGVMAKMEIKHSSLPTLNAWSIVSSPFYWPLESFEGNTADYVNDSTDARTLDTFAPQNSDISMDYRAWGFVQENNFARINVLADTCELEVQYFGSDGSSHEKLDANNRKIKVAERLTLERW